MLRLSYSAPIVDYLLPPRQLWFFRRKRAGKAHSDTSDDVKWSGKKKRKGIVRERRPTNLALERPVLAKRQKIFGAEGGKLKANA